MKYNSFKSIRNTGYISFGALTAAIALEGFEISCYKPYIEAHRGDFSMAVYPVNRCLTQNESTSVKATAEGIFKFMSFYDRSITRPADIRFLDYSGKLLLPDTNKLAVPCIGYVVCKRDYDDIDVCIIPIENLLLNSARGGIFSATSKSMSYDCYKTASSKQIPTGVLLRKQIKIK